MTAIRPYQSKKITIKIEVPILLLGSAYLTLRWWKFVAEKRSSRLRTRRPTPWRRAMMAWGI